MTLDELLTLAPGTKLQMTLDGMTFDPNVDGFTVKARPNTRYGAPMVVQEVGEPRVIFKNKKQFRSVKLLTSFGSTWSATLTEGDETFRVIP